jgi:oxygen-dependent protoporphyrinogen oxidase
LPVLVALLLGCLPGCARRTAPPSRSCDVVVIGGGIAGLAAAYALQDLDVVLLEKAERLGGRVWTREAAGIRYEAGALFGYPEAAAPPRFVGSPLFPVAAPLGFARDGRLFLGSTVREAIASYVADPAVLRDVDALADPRAAQAALARLRPAVRPILEAFFHVIHPGPMERYIAERLADALVPFDTRPRSGGNAELIAAYAGPLGDRVLLGAEAVSVERGDGGVVVRYRRGGVEAVLRARAAVLATGPAAARRIVRGPRAASAAFLDGISCLGGVAVCLGTRKAELPAFRYVVTPDQACNTVFRSPAAEAGTTVLTVYYVGDEAVRIARLPSERIVERTVEELAAAGIAALADDEILFRDVVVWDEVGCIISADPYEKLDAAALEPLDGVWLAGDYTFWDDGRMPYGMVAAAESGRRAARRVRERLVGRLP